jgi:hypothetical protein
MLKLNKLVGHINDNNILHTQKKERLKTGGVERESSGAIIVSE